MCPMIGKSLDVTAVDGGNKDSRYDDINRLDSLLAVMVIKLEEYLNEEICKTAVLKRSMLLSS